ncbi:MAG: hypothetical protein HXX15_12695 [Rhodopseudomonas sp.]|uniref:hypothetical protein n=1 Tax=Rhodopseudomonas sp. TaxID=1078 RepID=UPI00185C2CD5|nr:hypothetical protein [Rhodopseudomonas sp.]NVN86931.1 hypothetical protein [Rhodopseudomonas sp.]
MLHLMTISAPEQMPAVNAPAVSQLIFIAQSSVVAATIFPPDHPQLYLFMGLLLVAALRLNARRIVIANLAVSIVALGAIVAAMTLNRIEAGAVALHMPLPPIFLALFPIVAVALVLSPLKRRGGQQMNRSTHLPVAQRRLRSLWPTDAVLTVGRFAVVKNPIALLPVVDSCVSAMIETAERRQIEIKIDVSPSVPRYLNGDEASLRRLLCRLLENAIEAATQRCIVITVTVDEVGRSGVVRFAVGDRTTQRSHATQGARFEAVWRVVVSKGIAREQRADIAGEEI